jgi:hypothetical protein
MFTNSGFISVEFICVVTVQTSLKQLYFSHIGQSVGVRDAKLIKRLYGIQHSKVKRIWN